MPPLQFEPILKRIRWGGNRLGTLLGKPIGSHGDYAESWEIADHGSDQSHVTNGIYKGWTLHRLVEEKGAGLFGWHRKCRQFPLLIKFLDAHDRLSVQVHPHDKLAKLYDRNENGKTEAWVIVAAEPGSRLFAGLQTGVGQAEFETALKNGTTESCLHSFTVSPGDCVFIPAGTVHAIGEGILLAEIQQMSDITFRLYDWNRLDVDGLPRELHIDNGLNVIDFNRGPVSPVTPTIISSESHKVEQLVHSDYFVIHRHTLEKSNPPFTLSPNDRFHILMTLTGRIELSFGGESQQIDHGRTVLIPATAAETRITPLGDTIVLDSFLP